MRSETAIVTKRTIKNTLIMMLSAILGSVVGIMKLSILFMVKTEVCLGIAKKRIGSGRVIPAIKMRRVLLKECCGLEEDCEKGKPVYFHTCIRKSLDQDTSRFGNKTEDKFNTGLYVNTHLKENDWGEYPDEEEIKKEEEFGENFLDYDEVLDITQVGQEISIYDRTRML